jgi:DNA polymerase-3 subunit chi
VLIGCGALPEGVACLMAVDGAEVAPGEAAALEKCCILFDGADPAAVEGARAQWKALTGEGLAAAYWSEEGGRWQKKAVTGGRTEAGA